jgi:hypothetical protein
MGFLKADINGEDGGDPDEDLEEQYKRMMPKIGRDFVTREDLEQALSLIMLMVDPLGLSPVRVDDSAGRDLADRYLRLVDKGKSGGEEKRDLAQPKKEKEEK